MDVATILAYLKTPAVWLSRKVVNMAIGPRLRLEYNTVKWPRCREFVMAQSEPGASLWSPPATGALLTPESTSNALYIRTHVTNYGHLPARECVIFVERIYREGQLIETEESPIIWTDLDNFDARPIAVGGGGYADVCAVYRSSADLQVHSLKGRKGYGRLGRPGIYVLHISAKDLASGNGDSIRMEVQLGESDWDEVDISCTKMKNRWSLDRLS